MTRYLTVAAGFALIAGIACAQDVQTTTESHAKSKTTAMKKGGESYEWSVDTTTVKVPVHPTVTEKETTTTTTSAPVPPPVVSRQTTTTTTTGPQ